MEVNRENMCVILMAKGVVDDHLPNHILRAIKSCKTYFMDSPRTYNREAIQEITEKREKLAHATRRINHGHDHGTFNFPIELELEEGARNLGGGGRSKLKKQDNFDMETIAMSSLHPVTESSQTTASHKIITVSVDVMDNSSDINEHDSGTRQGTSVESETAFQSSLSRSQSSENFPTASSPSISTPTAGSPSISSSFPPTPITDPEEASTSTGSLTSAELNVTDSSNSVYYSASSNEFWN